MEIFKKIFNHDPKIARYLVVRTVIDNETAEYHFHVIFTKKDGWWIAELLESNNIIVYDKEFERCRWLVVDAVLCEIRFANKHGFLAEAFIKPSDTAIKKWEKLRKKEGLDTEPYIYTQFKFVYEGIDPKYSDTYAWDI